MRSLTAKAIFILLLLSAAAYGQDFNIYPFTMLDYSLSGAGARALAMGGAFTGVSDDASALTWNPAGLVQVDKTQASVAGLYLPLDLKTTLSFASNSPYNIDAKFKDDKKKPSFASFVAPIRIKGHPFMASATYSSPQNQINDVYNSALINYTAQAEFTYYTATAVASSRQTMTGGLDQISLGFGTGLYGDLSIGGAVNVYTGSAESNYRSEFVDTLPHYFGSVIKDSIQFKGVTTLFDKQTSTGVNITGSLFYHKDKFRAGVAFKTPFQLKTDHDLQRADTTYNKELHVIGDGLPTATRPSLYLGRTKIGYPFEGSLGISYQATPDLVLAGDIGYAKFSSTNYYVRAEIDSTDIRAGLTAADSINTFTLPGSMYYVIPAQGSYFTSAGKYIEVFNEFPLNLENSMRFSFGGEYSLKTKAGIVPLRAGVRIVQGPYREVTTLTRDKYGQPMNLPQGTPPTVYVLGKKVTQSTFAFGSGIHWRQIWLDATMEFSSAKQTEAGTAAWGNYNTEMKNTLPAVTLNFTGFF